MERLREEEEKEARWEDTHNKKITNINNNKNTSTLKYSSFSSNREEEEKEARWEDTHNKK